MGAKLKSDSKWNDSVGSSLANAGDSCLEIFLNKLANFNLTIDAAAKVTEDKRIYMSMAGSINMLKVSAEHD